jgi:FkbM family methyltransferase
MSKNDLSQLRVEFLSNKITKQSYIDQAFEIHKMLFRYKDVLKDSDIAKIEIIDGDIVVTSRQDKIKMYIDFDDKRSTQLEILNFGTYEGDDSVLMYELIQPNHVIFDIGANLGWYSLNFSKLAHDGKVYAFEPLPKTFEKCQRNLALNESQNVDLFNLALSDKEGEIKFFYNEKSSGSSSMKDLLELEDTIEVTCKLSTLDRFLDAHGGSIDFIKCDVEGAELLVFQGARNTLKVAQPIVFTEMLRKWSAKYDYHPNDIIDLFKEYDYECFYAKHKQLVKISQVTEETLETNFFFLHSVKHRNLIEHYESK